jgi:hypothetical protein
LLLARREIFSLHLLDARHCISSLRRFHPLPLKRQKSAALESTALTRSASG